MVLLENPAVALNIGVEDILEVLEDTLKEKNWHEFEIANLKLLYVPYFVFTYDTLVEHEVEGQAMSQGFGGGQMMINGVSGELEQTLSGVLEQQPINYQREIKHDISYDLLKPSFSLEEIKRTAQVKIASQFGIASKAVNVSGFRQIYWPIWRVFVQLGRQVQKMNVDAVVGITLNMDEVPTREKNWNESFSETLHQMMTPSGFMKVLSNAFSRLSGKAKAKTGEAKATSGASLDWLLKTKTGQYVLIAILILILFLLLT
ncbi:MAG: hypothetical protein J4432_01635 [DPANN group archaeon]|nr:hypothetical protein [DPANN group archaeon]